MGSLPGEAPREEAQPHEEAVTSRSIFGVSAMGYGATAADDSRADPQSDCSLSPIPEDSTRELESPAPQQPAQARYAALSKPSSSLRREEEARLQKLFEKADTDGGGTLQLKEIKALCKSMGDRLSTVALEEGFYRMDPEKTGTVDFESFRKWWRLKEDTARRDLRKNVEQVFRMADADASGQLDREEVGMMAAKITNKFAGAAFDPPFDLETDFAAMDVHGNGHVTYEEFAAWFKVRTGDDEPEIPVLPEYLVRKVSHLSARITHVQTIQDVGSFSEAAGAAATVGTENEQATGEERETGEKKEEHNGITGERRPARNGKELWSFLAPRLSVLVTLQKQWGRVSDLYGTGGSMFESNALPESLYDPDSDFAKWWDILQFAALLYIVFVTPMRIGFAEEVPLLSAAFCADAIVDVYFIIDIYLNFNTALWLENGTLETNSRAVRKRYLKGWFALDFLSSFPISYLLLIGRLLAGDTRGERDGYQRLLRLSKVMRLSRFRRVVKKYEDNGAIGDVTPYLGSIATVFIVLFSGHLLTCLWYFAGRSYGSIVCDPTESHLYADLLERISGHGLTPVQCLPMDDPTDGYEFKVPGWVIRQNYPNATTIGTKYIDAVYMVFLRPEIAFTGTELKLGLMSELVLALIFGSLAGVMSSIMIMMGSGQQDAMVKLLALKAWMRARGLKTSDKAKILAAFNQQVESSSFDQRAILSDLPPSLATDLAYFMYGKYLERMPLFRGLGTEVITETCKSVMDLKLSRDQIVYQEGRFGTEMYFLVSGEVEVSRDGERLGFLAEGAFFGETSFIESISGRGGDGSGIRTRTIRTVCACDFGVISQKDLRDVVETYPELKVRLQNFKLVGSVFTQKGKRKQEYRELKQQVMRAEGGDDDSPDTEHGFGTLVPPDVDGDDDADDVLNDALLAGIESDVPLPSPPRRQPSVPPTEAVSSDRALAAMQSQVSSLEAEMRAQLQLLRDEMANTRRELLAAINAVGTAAPPDTNGAPVRGVRAEHAKATGEQKAAGWGRREGGIGLGTAATIVAQTTNAARERRRRPSFE